jgi:hypothetical protein
MAKPGLYANINAKKKAGTSNTKKKSTISPEAYANMQAGFPNSKKNKAKKATATAMYGGKMKKPTKKMYGGKMHMNKKKGK